VHLQNDDFPEFGARRRQRIRRSRTPNRSRADTT
jgi:hypothetical protein